MDETNFDWDDLRLFLAVARNGGLHAAADATGKSAPTLGRRMLALERSLGKALFQRLPRGYALTEEGTDFLHEISAIEATLQPIVSSATLQIVKISAGSWMTQVLCAHADQIATNGIQLQFIAADHHLDIARREAVIGIRNQRPTQRGLAARKIAQVHFAGYAAATGLHWIKTSGSTPSAHWLADQDSQFTVNAPRNALDLALAGHGTALLPTFIGDDTPLMRTQDIPELTHDQWVVSHHEARFQPEVRATLERLYTMLETLHSKDG